MISLSIAVFLFYLLLTGTVNCERQKCNDDQNHPTDEDYTRLCEQNWAINHTFSASTKAPTATALNKQPKAKEALKTIIAHFEKQGNRVLEKLREARQPFVEPRQTPCNIPEDDAEFESVNTSTSLYGWGLMGKPCLTELESEPADTPVEAMETYLQAMNKVADTVAKDANMSDWEAPSTFIRFSYRSRTESCKLFHYVGFRVNGRWGVNTGFTNDKPNLFKEEWHRSYLVEILRLENDKITPTPLYMRKRISSEGNEFERNTTTLIATWGGAPATSLFTGVFNAANNPAVKAAIAVGADTREQVEDATTASNIAILIAPLALATVPVALFSNVDTFSLLAYTIVTDILSAMPLAIKGVELMQFGSHKYKATRTWLYGGRSEVDLAAAETWYAECDASSWVVLVGRVFLSMAILSMFLGVLFEVYARKVFEKRRLKRKEKLYEEWEMKASRMWTSSSPAFQNCTCCTHVPVSF